MCSCYMLRPVISLISLGFPFVFTEETIFIGMRRFLGIPILCVLWVRTFEV